MRSLMARVSTGLLTFVVIAVVFELTIRLDDLVRFGTPFTSPIAVEDELLTRDMMGEHGRAHAQFQKWTLNNLGMRGADVAVSKPRDVRRVVTAGASETFGLYESPGREYPRQLEDSLRQTLAASDCASTSIEVVNAAIFGMSLPSIDEDLKTRVRQLRPDVVVLYPTPVQYLADEIPSAALPDTAPNAGDLGRLASLKPRSTYRLREQIKAILPDWMKTWLRDRAVVAVTAQEGPGWRFQSIPAERLARYEGDLRRVIGTIRAIGAVPVLMTHADVFMTPGSREMTQLIAWERFYPRATGTVLIAFDSAGGDATMRVAKDSVVPVLDLAAIVRRNQGSDAAKLFGDYAHFTDRGAALVAGALRPIVIDAAHLPGMCRGSGPIAGSVARDHQ
jgi:hypothetical protein